MNRTISEDRFKKLKFEGFDKGEEILFCHECDWQAEPKTLCKNECPECGENLYLIGIDLAKNYRDESKNDR